MAITPAASPDTEASDVLHALRALGLRDVANREKDRRLRERVHGHVQQSREICERSAHAEGKGDEPHMLNGRIGEEPFDIAPHV